MAEGKCCTSRGWEWPHFIHQTAPASWCTLRAMNPRKAIGPDGVTGSVLRDLHGTASMGHRPNPSPHNATIFKVPRKTTISSPNRQFKSPSYIFCLYPHWTHFSLHTDLLHQQRTPTLFLIALRGSELVSISPHPLASTSALLCSSHCTLLTVLGPSQVTN